jgi:hypothetical protein
MTSWSPLVVISSCKVDTVFNKPSSVRFISSSSVVLCVTKEKEKLMVTVSSYKEEIVKMSDDTYVLKEENVQLVSMVTDLKKELVTKSGELAHLIEERDGFVTQRTTELEDMKRTEDGLLNTVSTLIQFFCHSISI